MAFFVELGVGKRFEFVLCGLLCAFLQDHVCCENGGDDVGLYVYVYEGVASSQGRHLYLE